MRNETSGFVTAVIVFLTIFIIVLGIAYYANIFEIRDSSEGVDDQNQYIEPPDDSEPSPTPSEPTSTDTSPSDSPGSTPSDTPSDTPSEPDIPVPDEKPEPLSVIPEYPQKQWTTLFYVAYDNSIGPLGIWESDLHFLEQIGTDDNINLVALVDQEIYDDCQVLIINEGESEYYPCSVIDPSWGDELNTGDAEVLYTFLEWGMKTFPANYYNVHIMDHGGGWMGGCIDETDNNSMISANGFADVYSRIKGIIGKKIDINSYDACFMGSFEFGWEICDSVQYLTGLQSIAAGDDNGEYILGNFEVYGTWKGLKDNPDWTPEDFAIHQVDSFYKVGPYLMPSLGQTQLYSSDTMSTSDLTKMEGLKESFGDLAEELYNSVIGENEVLAERQLILEVLGPSRGTPESTTESFTGQSDFLGLGLYYFYDLGDFVDRLIEFGDQLCSGDTASEFKELFDEVVVKCTHGDDAALGEHPDAQGLDIYVPYRNRSYDLDYDDTKISQDTLWDEFLKEVCWEL